MRVPLTPPREPLGFAREVVIDARPALDPRRTGVGHYTQQLIRHLPHADPDDEYVAWYLHAKGSSGRRQFFADGVGAEPVRAGVAVPGAGVRADVVAARRARASSGRSTSTCCWRRTSCRRPRSSPGVVMVVHDLAYEQLPETAPHMDARWRRRFDRWLARRAGRHRARRPSTRTDLLDAFTTSIPTGSRVTPLGVDAAAFAPRRRRAVDAVRRGSASTGRYALFVGGIEPRKNLETLVRRSRRCAPGTRLVIAGGPVRWDPKAADAAGRGDRGAAARARAPASCAPAT